MMLRIKLGVLATLVVLCIGQATATAATASEGELVNKEGGALVKNKFASTGGVKTIATVAGTDITCKSSIDHGIWTSKTGGEDTILFKECTTLGGTVSCKGGKDEAGEPKAGEVFMLLGLLIKRSNATERLILYTIHTPGTLEAGELEFVCSGVKIKLRGSFLSTSNYKTKVLSKTIELSFTQSKGKQAVTEYENEKGEKVKCKGLEVSVEGAAFEGAALEGKETDTLEEEAQFL